MNGKLFRPCQCFVHSRYVSTVGQLIFDPLDTIRTKEEGSNHIWIRSGQIGIDGPGGIIDDGTICAVQDCIQEWKHQIASITLGLMRGINIKLKSGLGASGIISSICEKPTGTLGLQYC